MAVPGSNLLAMALTVIASQPCNYLQWLSQATGPTGLSTSTYAAPVTVLKGSVQAVDRSRYEQLGLDRQKSYVTWYVPNVVVQSIRANPDGNGDVIEFPVDKTGALLPGARRYQIISDTPWNVQDKWVRVLGVDIGPATGATTNA
jgi:hypothetical protein